MQQRRLVIPPAVKLLAPVLLTVVPFIILPFFLVSHRIAPLRARVEPVPVRTETMRSAALLMRPAPPAAEPDLFGATNFTYNAPVLKTLRKMKLSIDHIDLWISEHPDSALKHLRFMSAAMQRDVASTALFIRSHNGRIDEKTAWREAVALVHYSAKYGVPSTFTTAVAHTESTFNPSAVSSKGAEGVMQVMWRFHDALLKSNGITGKASLSDPEKGIAAGCLLLSRYIKAYGSIQTAMTRYYGASSLGYQSKVNRNMMKIATHHANMR